MLALRALDGRPIALVANYSMHYFGSPLVSADYYGYFAEAMKKLAGAENSKPEFVVMMSQGTSGDAMWLDYGRPPHDIGLERYASDVAQVAFGAYKQIQYRRDASLAMAETELTARYRPIGEARLAEARQIVKSFEGERPRHLKRFTLKRSSARTRIRCST